MELNRGHVVLVGAGIMSATLGVLLKELVPEITIDIFERLDKAAQESSDAWNNAGTGHSAFCEMNYTPEMDDGTIDVSKALKIAEAYEVSRAFWASLVEKGALTDPSDFVNSLPHISFVNGGQNVEFLEKRFSALSMYKIFSGLQYSPDPEILKEWMPLVMEGRDENEDVAATRMGIGTDVNFGTLTNKLIHYMDNSPGSQVFMHHEVRDIKRLSDGKWEVLVKDLATQQLSSRLADFVFIGAGGGTLPLLEKADIPEAIGYGGFPVSGEWLKCSNDAVIAKHYAKVYGKAAVGAPPMSVPHLDTRIINGKRELLFGPYAGFLTKFLKQGSYWDLLLSIESDNIYPMLQAGWQNIPLTKYLVEQVIQSDEERLKTLREYFPEAKKDDWHLSVAGQRVQVIKKNENGEGVLGFGTEVVSAKDGTISGLLGASPGASTAVQIMLEVLQDCFPGQMRSEKWVSKLKGLIPFYGHSLLQNNDLLLQTRERSAALLQLKG